MKLGIVTFHRAHNCGAALQCVALITVLQRMGHEVKVVDCNQVGESHWPGFRAVWSLRGLAGWVMRFIMSIGIADMYFLRYWRFRKKFMPRTDRFTGGSLPVGFDRYIVGSDQVFNPEITGDQTGVFLLEGLADDAKKCCYAASFGAATLPNAWRPRFAKALARFSYLGFRETSAKTICDDELGIDGVTTTVLDPTLLLDSRDYIEMECPVKTNRGFVVVYWAGRCGEEARSIADQIARRHSLDVVFVNQNQLTRFKKRKNDYIAVSPDRFLWLMRNAKFVISTSFHGTAFAIINRKPFIVLRPRGYNLNERIVDLLGRLGISNQVVYDDAIPQGEALEARFTVDYSVVDERLNELRSESIEFLRRIASWAK